MAGLNRNSTPERQVKLQDLPTEVFTCGVCETIISKADVIAQKHECFHGFSRLSLGSNYYIYPKHNDGTVFRRSKMNNGQEKVVNDSVVENLESVQTENQYPTNENIDSNNLPKSNAQMILPSICDASFTENLIHFVQEREGIWNIKGIKANKRSSGAKDELWKDVSEFFIEKPDIELLKKKWKNLVDQYQREVRSLKGTTGQAASKKRKWAYFDMMSFLEDVDLENQDTVSNMSRTVADQSSGSSAEQNYDESLSSLDNFHNIPPLSEIMGDDDYSSCNSKTPARKSKTKKCQNIQLEAASRLAAAIEASSPVINFPSLPALPPPPTPTATGAFAHYVEMRLNDIPNATDREEIMDNTYQFITREIRRIRQRNNQ